jgi:hypothetical protein
MEQGWVEPFWPSVTVLSWLIWEFSRRRFRGLRGVVVAKFKSESESKSE